MENNTSPGEPTLETFVFTKADQPGFMIVDGPWSNTWNSSPWETRCWCEEPVEGGLYLRDVNGMVGVHQIVRLERKSPTAIVLTPMTAEIAISFKTGNIKVGVSPNGEKVDLITGTPMEIDNELTNLMADCAISSLSGTIAIHMIAHSARSPPSASPEFLSSYAAKLAFLSKLLFTGSQGKIHTAPATTVIFQERETPGPDVNPPETDTQAETEKASPTAESGTSGECDFCHGHHLL